MECRRHGARDSGGRYRRLCRLRTAERPAGAAHGSALKVSEWFRPIVGVGFVQTAVAFIGGFLLIIPGVFGATMLYVATPVCLIEQRRTWPSLLRSAVLTKGYRWSVFGLLMVVNLVPTVALGVVYVLMSRSGGRMAGHLVMYVLEVAFNAFSGVVALVVYQGLRTAKEGLAVEALAEVFA
jgi:hypothetical protein